jgi:potassium-transporting ATPase KdpC subunit
MRRELRISLVSVVVLTILLGLVYPLVMTAVSQVVFPGRASGSLITKNGKVVGSRLIAQPFAKPVLDKHGKPETTGTGLPVLSPDPAYFQERPSTQTEYNAAASSFTNLGPNSTIAEQTFSSNLKAYLKLEQPYDPGLSAAQVPIDAVTSSGSGVDPEISVANADIQAHRIAAVRHLSMSEVMQLIKNNTDTRFIDLLGESGVNVLDLNLELDHVTGGPR